MAVDLKASQFEQFERTHLGRSFSIEDHERTRLHNLTSELFEHSADLRENDTINFGAVGVVENESPTVFKTSVVEKENSHAWQILMGFGQGDIHLLDGIVAKEYTEFTHVEVDHQGALRQKAKITEDNDVIVDFLLRQYEGKKPFQKIGELLTAKAQLTHALQEVKDVKGIFKPRNEAEACLRGIKLFGLKPRGLKNVDTLSGYKQVSFVDMEDRLVEPIRSFDVQMAIEYRPKDLSKIQEVAEKLLLLK